MLMLEYRPSPTRASKRAISSSSAELEAVWDILPFRYVVFTPSTPFLPSFLLAPTVLSPVADHSHLILPQVRRNLRRNRHRHRLPRQRILRPFHRGLALPLVPVPLPFGPHRLRPPAHQQSGCPRRHCHGGTSGCVCSSGGNVEDWRHVVPEWYSAGRGVLEDAGRDDCD